MAGAEFFTHIHEYVDDRDEGFEQGDIGGLQNVPSLPPRLGIDRHVPPWIERNRTLPLFMQNMIRLMKRAEEDLVLKLIPTFMETLTEDTGITHVKTYLEHFPSVASQVAECSKRLPALKNFTSEHLIPILVRHLGCSNAAIENAAQTTLFKFITQGYITKPQVEIQVCPHILALTKAEKKMEVNTGAIKLMGKLALLLGKDITERVLLPRFLELCDSNTFYVRKACAFYIGGFCVVAGKETYENSLLRAYVKLCGDGIWGVRKSCAESAIFVSSTCNPETRSDVLVPAFTKLLQDENRWVRLVAFQMLGPLIATFAKPSITKVGYSPDYDLVLQGSNGHDFILNNSYWVFSEYQYDSVESFFGNEEEQRDIYEMEEPEKEDETEMDKMSSSSSSSSVAALPPTTATEDGGDVKDEYIKEIVETVKNAVLSYRTENEPEEGFLVQKKDEKRQWKRTQSISCTVTPPDVCDAITTHLDDEQSKINDDDDDDDVVVVSKVNVSGSDASDTEDDLNLYSELNYWYNRPSPIELLDVVGLLDSEENTTAVNNVEDERRGDDVASHLEQIYSTMNLSDTMHESTSAISNHTNNDSISLNESTSQTPQQVEAAVPQQKVVPQVLLDHFVSMTDHSLALNLDSEIAFHCAYSLPAVAMTLGKENWHLLNATAKSLANDMQYKVRRTIANSLHELATMLGPEIATETLTPLFDGFLKDLDEVRIGVLKHLCHFMGMIEPARRAAYLPKFQEFLLVTDNTWNWRIRHILVTQLQEMLPLLQPSEAPYLANFVVHLMCDKVAVVRNAAIMAFTETFGYLAKETGRIPNMVTVSENFAHSKIWRQRQTFVLLCSELIARNTVPPKMFASDMLPYLLDLSWDPVANVRLVVAKCLSKHLMANEYFSDPDGEHYHSLETALSRLQADKDRDVRQSAEMATKNATPSS